MLAVTLLVSPTKELTPKTKANIFWGYIYIYINHWSHLFHHFSSFFILNCIRKNNRYFTFCGKILRFNLQSSMFCWKVKPFGRTIVNEFRHDTIFFWRLFNTLIFWYSPLLFSCFPEVFDFYVRIYFRKNFSCIVSSLACSGFCFLSTIKSFSRDF